jgi:hypothetical protein
MTALQLAADILATVFLCLLFAAVYVAVKVEQEEKAGALCTREVSVRKLVIGSAVHFYTKDTAKQFNGNGEGPYPAIVTQTFGSDEMANLKVIPGFGPIRDEGSIHIKEGLPAPGMDYFEWPKEEVFSA